MPTLNVIFNIVLETLDNLEKKQSKYATANQLTLMVRAYNHNLIQQLFLKVL